MLNATFLYCYALCRYAECRYAEYRYAECRYAECRGALKTTQESWENFNIFSSTSFQSGNWLMLQRILQV